MRLQLKGQEYLLSSSTGFRHFKELEVCQEHTHDFIEIVYIFSGKSNHNIDGKPYTANKGDMLIIDCGQKHSITGGKGEYVNIFLKPEFINESLKNHESSLSLLNLKGFSVFRETLTHIKNMVTFTDFERNTVETVILNLETELNDAPAGYEVSTYAWYNLLLVMIFRKMSLLTPRFDGISEELLLYLRTHCHERLEMNKIASLCHYNPAYFCRSFKEFAGVTFTQYLKNARIERAMQLLAGTKLQIHEICDEVGYVDKTKFFQDFRQIAGVTPLAYRKSMKQ